MIHAQFSIPTCLEVCCAKQLPHDTLWVLSFMFDDPYTGTWSASNEVLQRALILCASKHGGQVYQFNHWSRLLALPSCWLSPRENNRTWHTCSAPLATIYFALYLLCGRLVTVPSGPSAFLTRKSRNTKWSVTGAIATCLFVYLSLVLLSCFVQTIFFQTNSNSGHKSWHATLDNPCCAHAILLLVFKIQVGLIYVWLPCCRKRASFF